MKYVIYSRKHTRGIVTWWRPNRAGYTQDLRQAGRYTLKQALKICMGHEDETVAIPLKEALALPWTRQTERSNIESILP